MLLALALLISLGLTGYAAYQPAKTVQTAAKQSNAATFHYACSGKSVDKQSLPCLEQTYATMTQKHGAAVSFAALKAAYSNDKNGAVKSDCHQLTHAIGRAEADSVKDVDQAYALGDNFCWSGYYHGVMESIVTRIGAKNVTSKLPTICASLKAKQPYSFSHYNCVHGLGHGIMDIDGSKLFSALKTCDLLSDSWEQQSCYGGVFMENGMDEVNPDHHTAYLKADEPMYPCTAVAETYKSQCYLSQTSHALRLADYNFAQVFDECGAVEAPFANICYQSLGRDASGNTNSQAEQTKVNCMYGPTQDARENCIIGAVKDFVSYFHSDQQAGDFCNILDDSLLSVCQTTKTDYFKTL